MKIKSKTLLSYPEKELSDSFYEKLKDLIGKKVKFMSPGISVPVSGTVKSYTVNMQISYGGTPNRLSDFNKATLSLYIEGGWCDSSFYGVKENSEIEILD